MRELFARIDGMQTEFACAVKASFLEVFPFRIPPLTQLDAELTEESIRNFQTKSFPFSLKFINLDYFYARNWIGKLVALAGRDPMESPLT